jgi:apolipoprotein N-acyltransferase
MKLHTSKRSLLTPKKALIIGVTGVLIFHVAYAIDQGILMVVFLWCLLRGAELPSARSAFYAGLLIGLGMYAPQLGFFWTLFGAPALTLWLVLAFWIGLFVVLCHLACRQWGLWTAGLVPFLWTGLEYFRSELYYLRFSWLNTGFAFSDCPALSSLAFLGVYGIGFVLVSMAALLWVLPLRVGLILALILLPSSAALLKMRPETDRAPGASGVTVAGVQIEFPAELEVPGLLDQALQQYPKAQLFVLSEYTFDGPVPRCVKQWCKKNERYLVAGGKDAISSSEFYNTAFVIGPSGEIVFKQAKSVPIQFFKDGLPAPEQKVWESPWGKLGICICYDLSYSRVTDALIRQGARALLVPTMDVIDWGEHEHQLHARVAPMKAAEYGVPIFRVASSGVSQLVEASGGVRFSIPFAEQGKIISGHLNLSTTGRLPMDRYLAPWATVITGLWASWLIAAAMFRLRTHHPCNPFNPR